MNLNLNWMRDRSPFGTFRLPATRESCALESDSPGPAFKIGLV